MEHIISEDEYKTTCRNCTAVRSRRFDGGQVNVCGIQEIENGLGRIPTGQDLKKLETGITTTPNDCPRGFHPDTRYPEEPVRKEKSRAVELPSSLALGGRTPNGLIYHHTENTSSW